MARLTITLSDERHQALEEAAARRRKSIGQLVEESLESCGIKSGETAARLVAEARALRCHPAVLVFPGWDVERGSAA